MRRLSVSLFASCALLLAAGQSQADLKKQVAPREAEAAFRQRAAITVIAILREPEPVVGAQPGDVIERGDTLVTVGKLGQYPAFRKLLAVGPF